MLGSSPVSASAARDAAARLLKPQDLRKQGPDHAPRTFGLDPRYPMVSIEQTLQAQLRHVTVMSEPKIAMEVARNIIINHDISSMILYIYYCIYFTYIIHSYILVKCNSAGILHIRPDPGISDQPQAWTFKNIAPAMMGYSEG